VSGEWVRFSVITEVTLSKICGMVNAAAKSPRIRRSVDDAREAILEAAERRLIAGGPDAVRVQTVARDVGITDAAVHYHFGNREGLMDALLRRAGRRLRDELEAVADRWDTDTLDVGALIELFEETYARRQYARLTAWMTLHGWRPKGSGMLRDLAEGFHAARSAHVARTAAAKPTLEDTLFVLELIHVFVWAEALIGSSSHRMVGLPANRTTEQRFKQWFAQLAGEHLTSGGKD
jgi:AcrR family transcriptional regulator